MTGRRMAATDVQFPQACHQRAARFANPLRERVALVGAKLLKLLYDLMTGPEKRQKSAPFIQLSLPPSAEALKAVTITRNSTVVESKLAGADPPFSHRRAQIPGASSEKRR